MTTITLPTAGDVLHAIDWIGDDTTITVDDVTLRIHVEPDYLTDISDFDVYGHVIGCRRSATYGWDEERPAGFDGNAVKIDTRDGRWWWQPYLPTKADRTQWQSDPTWRRTMKRQIADLLEYGFSVIVVERLDGTDAYRRPIVADYWALGGIEPFCDQDDLRLTLYDFLVDNGFPDDRKDTHD